MTQLAVLIPTLNRADVLPRLVAEIRANTMTKHRIYFVAEDSDEATAEVLAGLTAPDVTAIVGDFGSCAAAYNAGYRGSSEPYIFLANDDLEFPEGWELPALRLIKQGTPIVGVNEGHNRMTCFSMVERDFIKRESGVYDAPDTLVHPYTSQYVDTELAEYAKHRGVWGEAREGGVIHRHWEWGDADPSHPNYVKAKATVSEDHRLYSERRAAWLAT